MKKQNFEKNIDRLREIIEQLESGELSLDKGVALYKEGQALSAACRGQLEEARLVVSQVTPDGIKPFDTTSGEEN